MKDEEALPIVIIESHSGWRAIDWKEINEYRDLLWFMIWRNVKVRYAQSAVGVGWAILQPVATMLVFTVIFGNLVGIQSDGSPYAIFAFVALVPWTYFSNCLTEGTDSMVANAHMISKIYFPRLIMPFSILGARLLDFFISFAVLIILLLFYDVKPNFGIIVIPLLLVIMALSAAGISLALTAMAIQYRDIKYGMTFAVQLLMYAAPVVYPESMITGWWRYLYALNPMAGVIEGFRSALLSTRPMPWEMILIGGVMAILLFVGGIMYFRRKEHIFADVA